jgi:hypothetical protein
VTEGVSIGAKPLDARDFGAPDAAGTPIRLIFRVAEWTGYPHSDPIMEQQQKMTKQGVRDLDFGQSTKRRVAAEAKSDPSLDGQPAAVPPVDEVAPSAVASPLEK